MWDSSEATSEQLEKRKCLENDTLKNSMHIIRLQYMIKNLQYFLDAKHERIVARISEMIQRMRLEFHHGCQALTPLLPAPAQL